MTPNPNENQASKCNLCDIGFPMVGDDHIPTQSLGMIPVTRCRKLPTLEKPNKNQAEKHSAEPLTWREIVFQDEEWTGNPATRGKTFVVSRWHLDQMCCAIESLSALNTKLTAELSTLRKELEEAKIEIASMIGGAADEPLRQEELEFSREELLLPRRTGLAWSGKPADAK